MPAGTNATVAIVGDTLITAASFPQSKGQRPQIIAYRLGATGTETTTTTGTTTGPSEVSGEQVFASSCGSCHTLGAAGTSGSIGPNLDDLMPDEATVEEKVRNGGGGMPSFEGRLSDEEIAAVATYVAENAGTESSDGGGQGP
jgi:mono/diheme cytochrome c family protein